MKIMAWPRLHWPLILLLLVAASSLAWPIEGGWLSRLAMGWDVGVGLFLIECLFRLARARSTDAHVPTELDWQPNEFLDSERRYILCAVHGAVYSPKTGACVMGRCGRAGLIPVAVAEFDGQVHWYPSDTLQPPLPPSPRRAA